MPPWIEFAQNLIGIQEFPGNQNNTKILAWAKVIGGKVENDYIADSIPWCGLFVAYCMVSSGIKPVDGPLWALSWSKFGKSIPKPFFGSIISLKRDGGGHVGFVVSQDSINWHVLGGNQSNAVNITRIPKSRSAFFNWPNDTKFEKFKTQLPFKPYDGKILSVTDFE